MGLPMTRLYAQAMGGEVIICIDCVDLFARVLARIILRLSA